MPRQGKHRALWPGLLLVFALALGGVLVSGLFDFFEAIHRHTRPYKIFFIDEMLFFLPSFLLLGLAVFLFLTNRRLRSETILRQRNEEKLEKLTEEWRVFSRHGPAVFYTALPSGDYGATYMSPNVKDILGYAPEQFLDDPGFWLNHVHPADREQVLSSLARLHQENKAVLRYRFRAAGGPYLWIRDELILQKDEQGQASRIIGYMVDITERKLAEEALRESEKRFKDIAHSMADWIWEVDKSGRYTFSSTAAKQILGYEPEEIIGKTPFDLMTPEEAKRIEPIFHGIASQKKPIVDLENWNLNKQGEKVCLLTSGVPLLDEKGELLGYRGVDKDITERKRTQELIRDAEVRYRTIFEGAAEGIIIAEVETKKFLLANPAICQMLGYSEDELKKMTILDIHPRESIAHVISEFEAQAHHGKRLAPKLPCLRKDESIFSADVYTTTALIDGKECIIGFFIDVTERERAEEEILRMARYDTLTGLPNRNLFAEHLITALARANRNQRMVALLFMDLDRFKNVNDTLGHPVGDLLLKQVAERLRSELRGADIVARFGGDEFAILQADLPAIDGTRTLADRILNTVSQPYTIKGHLVHVTTSMGIAVHTPEHPVYPAGLLAQADRALYQAKAKGRNRFFFHDQEMEREVRSHVALTNDLHQALERHEFRVHYQPQVAIPSGRIIGLEALLRWRHPERGLLLPCDFIKSAEDSGLIIPLGQWVLREALRQLKAWREQGLALGIHVAVNLSPVQVSAPGFAPVIRDILGESGLPPECLELEITEDVLMESTLDAIGSLENLRQKGIKMSIDDFGTGYSSLKYLKKLPIHKLKIAQEFVLDLPADPDDAAIISAIIRLGRRMNLAVIAEGVETAEQLNYLTAEGCTEAQGFYFARPQPGEALTPLLLKGRVDS